MTGRIGLSKSRYLYGLQCPKLLWCSYHDPDALSSPDPGQQARYDEGHRVGRLAQTLFPGGVDLSSCSSAEALERSATLLGRRVPLFEAAFAQGPAFFRVDVLNPVGTDEWDLVEVKSTSKVKPVHLQDVAFQRYVCEGCGIKLRRCYVMHLNSDYVRQGELDLGQLFVREDVTDRLSVYSKDVAVQVAAQCEVLKQAQAPQADIGLHCNKPYECPLKATCWRYVPEDSVFSLYRMRTTTALDWLENGIQCILDLPEQAGLTTKQEIQRTSLQCRRSHVNRGDIERFLAGLQYPLYYLDFETFMEAIPRFDGTKPFMQVPFQFSLHIKSSPDSEPEHHSFLAEGTSDPRPELLKRLGDLLGAAGSIVAYNAGFEKRCLKESAAACPKEGCWVETALARFIDLLKPFRAFHYYHPAQHGSASIKKVLPALTGQSYSDMDIAEGATASVEYMRVTFGTVSEEDRQQVRDALEQYCKLDTQAMIDIVGALGLGGVG